MPKDDGVRRGLSGWILGAPRRTVTDGSGRSMPWGDIHQDQVMGRRTLGPTHRRKSPRHERKPK